MRNHCVLLTKCFFATIPIFALLAMFTLSPLPTTPKKKKKKRKKRKKKKKGGTTGSV